MTMNRHLLTAAIFTAALISPTMGTAQTLVSSPIVTANELHERAAALYETPARWREAAHILRQECELRSVDDPQAFGCFDMSAKLFFYVGDLTDARGMMAKAAEQALANGDVVQAANAYVNTAFIAQKQGNSSKLAAFRRKAELLASSPLLTAGQSSAIVDRLSREELAFQPEP